MGIGATAVQGSTANPVTFLSPINYGGDTTVGNVSNGGITQQGSSKAEGGSFNFDLGFPMPKLQLQNLD